MAQTTTEIIVTNAGGGETLTPDFIADVTLLSMDSGSVTLAADYTLTYTTLPEVGASWSVIVSTGLDLNGNILSIYGVSYGAQRQAANTVWVFTFVVVDILGVPTLIFTDRPQSFGGTDPILYGRLILDNSLALSKLVSGTSAQMIVCNVSGVPVYVSMTGDVTTSNAGVTAIGAGKITNSMVNASAGIVYSKMEALTALKLLTTDASGFPTTAVAGVIVNADINAAAAIVFSKMAALTASKAVVTDASGIITTANYIPPLLGGNGIDNSAATGFPIWTAGTNSVGAFTDVRHIDNISFVTANQGTYYVFFPFPCTVTAINVRVTSVVSGTDDGELTIANNAGTVMTGSALTAGVLAVAASSAFGTGYASTLLTNNTFTAGQYMKITSAKVTTGGIVSADITYTRTTLN